MGSAVEGEPGKAPVRVRGSSPAGVGAQQLLPRSVPLFQARNAWVLRPVSRANGMNSGKAMKPPPPQGGFIASGLMSCQPSDGALAHHPWGGLASSPDDLLTNWLGESRMLDPGMVGESIPGPG
jgi:hypothetical protein